jgi:NADPH:quinone reductase-like Zn-dependent oxidoreductase
MAADAVTAVQVVSPSDAEPDTLVLRETAVPSPSSDQVRVEVRAVGVNPTDWKSVRTGPACAASPRTTSWHPRATRTAP